MYVLNATCILHVMQGPSIADRLAAAEPVTCGTCMATPMSPGKEIERDGRQESRRRENGGNGRRIIEKNKENMIKLNKRRIISLVTVISPGLPWGRNFYPHTHPIPTENPVSILTGSPYPQNPKILHTRTRTLSFHYKRPILICCLSH